MTTSDEGDLFTTEQRQLIDRARSAFAGRDGTITLRYKRGQLAAIRYCLPGKVQDLKEAVAKLREAGSYGEIVIIHTPNATLFEVAVSREYPLKRG